MIAPTSIQITKPVTLVEERITLSAPEKTTLNKKIIVAGTVTETGGTSAPITAISIQKKIHNNTWRADAHAIVHVKAAQGHFRATIAMRKTGAVTLRARVLSLNKFQPVTGTSAAVTLHVAAPPMIMYAAQASFYVDIGMGLACGGVMDTDTLGVANKTLPCGTPVTIRYHAHTITVPVIDRGPYVAGRSFDLSSATVAALHFDTSKGVDTIHTNPAGE